METESSPRFSELRQNVFAMISDEELISFQKTMS
jgi:hypothetical protein